MEIGEAIKVYVRVRPRWELLPESCLGGVSYGGDVHNGNCATVEDDKSVRITACYACRCEACMQKNLMAAKIEMFGSRKKQDKLFKFDQMFSDTSTQDEIYERVSDIIKSAVLGYNATIFAYGATGSGKTYTMMGTTSSPGIIPRAINDIFENINIIKDGGDDAVFHVEVSFVELYNNNFRNLLKTVPEIMAKNKLKSVSSLSALLDPTMPLDGTAKSDIITADFDRDFERFFETSENAADPTSLATLPTFLSDKIEIHESEKTGVFLTGPNLKMVVKTVEEAVQLVAIGNQFRAVAPIQCNDLSSRSHSILTFYIESRVITRMTQQHRDDESVGSVAELRLGKIHLVDLAGSERLNESKAEGETLVETQNINKSLLALGDVLHALSMNATAIRKNQRIEYENSNLASDIKSTESGSAPSSTSRAPRTPLIPHHSFSLQKTSNVHIPYLNSKLTHLLKDSLGGNTKTVMMCNVSPEMEHYHQTLYTLMYASRAKKVRNITLVNRIEIGNDLMDLSSEANLFNQLKLKLLADTPRDKYGRKIPSSHSLLRSQSSFTAPSHNPIKKLLTLQGFLVKDLEYLFFPMQPCLKVQVGSFGALTKTQLYTNQQVSYAEVLTVEIEIDEYNAGIEVEIEVRVQPITQKAMVPIGKGKVTIKSAVTLDGQMCSVTFPLTGSFLLNNEPVLVQRGFITFQAALTDPPRKDSITLHESQQPTPPKLSSSRSATPNRSSSRSTTPNRRLKASQSFVFPPDSSPVTKGMKRVASFGGQRVPADSPAAPKTPREKIAAQKPGVLHVKRIVCQDLATVVDSPETGQSEMYVILQLGLDKRAVEVVGKHGNADVSFDKENSLKFDVDLDSLRWESLNIKLFDVNSTTYDKLVGEAYTPIHSLGSRRGELIDFPLRLKNGAYKSVGCVIVSLRLTKVLREIVGSVSYDQTAVQSPNSSRSNAVTPMKRSQSSFMLMRQPSLGNVSSLSAAQPAEELLCGWFRINTIVAENLNKFKLLGKRVRYNNATITSESPRKISELVGLQDPFITVELGSTWSSKTEVLRNQGSDCVWYNADLRYFFDSEVLTQNLLKFTVYDHYEDRPDAQIGTAIVSLASESGVILAGENMELSAVVSNKSGKYCGRLIMSCSLTAETGTWYFAVINHDREDGTYDVEYWDGEIEPAVSKDLIVRVNCTSVDLGVATFSPGDAISVFVERKNRWQVGRIAVSRGCRLYDIECANGEILEKVSEERIAVREASSHFPSKIANNAKFRFGDKIEANFKCKGKWYSGRIRKHYRSENTYTVHYDNGDVELSVEEDRLRFPERSSSVTRQRRGGSMSQSGGDLSDPTGELFIRSLRREPSPTRIGRRSRDASPLVGRYRSSDHFERKASPLTRTIGRLSYNDLLATPSPTPHMEDPTNHKAWMNSLRDGKSDSNGLRGLRRLSSTNFGPDSVAGSSSDVGSSMHRRTPSFPFGDKALKRPDSFNSGRYSPDERVEVNYRKTGTWLPATVWRTRGEHLYDVDYGNGDYETAVLEENIRPIPHTTFNTGDIVEANYRGIGKWLPGTIRRERGNNEYDIDFDMGKMESRVSDLLIRLIRPGEPKEDTKYHIFDKVEVFYDIGVWRLGTVMTVYPIVKGVTVYDIEYVSGAFDEKVSEEHIRKHEPSSAVQVVKTKHHYEVGDRVDANYRELGKWQRGVIKRDRGGFVYDIDYSNGMIETKVNSELIRLVESISAAKRIDGLRASLIVGTRVEVNYWSLGAWYPGTIRKLNGKNFDVQYDDDERESDVSIENIRSVGVRHSVLPPLRPVFKVGDRVKLKSRSREVIDESQALLTAKLQAEEEMTILAIAKGQIAAESGLLASAKTLVDEESQGFLFLKQKIAKCTATLMSTGSAHIKLSDKDFSGEESAALSASLARSKEEVRALAAARVRAGEEGKAVAASLQRDTEEKKSVAAQNGSMEFQLQCLVSAKHWSEEESRCLVAATDAAIEELNALSIATCKAEEEVKALSAARVKAEQVLHALDGVENARREMDAADLKARREADETRLRLEGERAAVLAEVERQAEVARLEALAVAAEEARLAEIAWQAWLAQLALEAAAEEARIKAAEKDAATMAEEKRLAEIKRLATEEEAKRKRQKAEEMEALRLIEAKRLAEIERIRVAEERRKAEEMEAKRLAEIERIRVAEERRKAEEMEAKRLAEIERIRVAEERRKAEEMEAKRLAEIERIRSDAARQRDAIKAQMIIEESQRVRPESKPLTDASNSDRLSAQPGSILFEYGLDYSPLQRVPALDSQGSELDAEHITRRQWETLRLKSGNLSTITEETVDESDENNLQLIQSLVSRKDKLKEALSMALVGLDGEQSHLVAASVKMEQLHRELSDAVERGEISASVKEATESSIAMISYARDAEQVIAQRIHSSRVVAQENAFIASGKTEELCSSLQHRSDIPISPAQQNILSAALLEQEETEIACLLAALETAVEESRAVQVTRLLAEQMVSTGQSALPRLREEPVMPRTNLGSVIFLEVEKESSSSPDGCAAVTPDASKNRLYNPSSPTHRKTLVSKEMLTQLSKETIFYRAPVHPLAHTYNVHISPNGVLPSSCIYNNEGKGVRKVSALRLYLQQEMEIVENEQSELDFSTTTLETERLKLSSLDSQITELISLLHNANTSIQRGLTSVYAIGRTESHECRDFLDRKASHDLTISSLLDQKNAQQHEAVQARQLAVESYKSSMEINQRYDMLLNRANMFRSKDDIAGELQMLNGAQSLPGRECESLRSAISTTARELSAVLHAISLANQTISLLTESISYGQHAIQSLDQLRNTTDPCVTSLGALLFSNQTERSLEDIVFVDGVSSSTKNLNRSPVITKPSRRYSLPVVHVDRGGGVLDRSTDMNLFETTPLTVQNSVDFDSVFEIKSTPFSLPAGRLIVPYCPVCCHARAVYMPNLTCRLSHLFSEVRRLEDRSIELTSDIVTGSYGEFDSVLDMELLQNERRLLRQTLEESVLSISDVKDFLDVQSASLTSTTIDRSFANNNNRTPFSAMDVCLTEV